MKKIIATWIYLDSKTEESNYPQVGTNSSSEKFQEVYWKCIVVFFETSLRFNQNVEHILFTNSEQTKLLINEYDIYKYLINNNISVRVVKNNYVLPSGYYQSWNNQFFEFSIFEDINSIIKDEDIFLLLDSDCVFTKNIDHLFNKLIGNKNEALTYAIDYDPDHSINGCSRKQMQSIFKDLGLELDKLPQYSAGEVFFAKGIFISKICREFPILWKDLMQRFVENRIKFNEEAHALSYFYHKFYANIGSLNSNIKRCWTDPFNYRNVRKSDFNLDILHLPVEKKTGISNVFNKISKGQNIKLIDENEYRIILKDLLSPYKYFKTLIPRIIKKINAKINNRK